MFLLSPVMKMEDSAAIKSLGLTDNKSDITWLVTWKKLIDCLEKAWSIIKVYQFYITVMSSCKDSW